METLAPYMKNPAPCESVPAGFISHWKPPGHEEPVFPGQVFNSYGAWFQAHQPKEVAPSTTVRTTKASSYWPFGAGVTSVIGSRNNHDILIIDNARSRGTLPYRPTKANEPQRSGSQKEFSRIFFWGHWRYCQNMSKCKWRGRWFVMEDGTKPFILLKLWVAYTSKINVFSRICDHGFRWNSWIGLTGPPDLGCFNVLDQLQLSLEATTRCLCVPSGNLARSASCNLRCEVSPLFHECCPGWQKKADFASLNSGDGGFAQMLIPFLTPVRLGWWEEIGIKEIYPWINQSTMQVFFLVTILLGVKSLGMTATSLEKLSMQESGCCWPDYFLINGTAQKSQGLHMIFTDS